MSKPTYFCKKCNFISKNKYNFNKHCKTKKHKEKSCLQFTDESLHKNDERLQKNDEKSCNNKFTCEYCHGIFAKTNKTRHYSNCKIMKDNIVNIEIKQLQNLTLQLKEQLNKKDRIIENKIKNIEKELNEKNEKRIHTIEKDMFELMKTIVLTNKNNSVTNNTNNTTNKINNNNYNMYYIINNFTEAENIEDLLKAPLTKEELDYIHKNGSILGSYKVIKDRCITDKDVSKRPVHCTDIPRKKYLLRHNNEWIIDAKADQLLTMTFNKMQDAYDLECEDQLEKLKYTQELIKLNIDGRKRLNGQISKDVLLKNNVN
jgi:hypothetical protein